MLCPNCKSEVADYSQVCPFCGHNFFKENSQFQNSNQNQIDMNQHYFQQNVSFGSNMEQQGHNQQLNQNSSFDSFNSTYAQQTNQKPKSNKGCMIALIVVGILVLLFIGSCILGGTLLYNFGKGFASELPNAIEQIPIEDIAQEFSEGMYEVVEEIENGNYTFEDTDGDGNFEMHINLN